MVLLFSTTATASHYFVEDLDETFSPQVIEELHNMGIQTTEHLLLRALTKKDRKQIAGSTSLEASKIEEIARLMELLQIKGVGPKAARLITKTGITSIEEFSKRNPEEFLKKIIDVNQTHHLTNVDPDLALIQDWIEKAKKAPHHVLAH